ncbi:hypothetical protein LguiB_007173 [Lonicera macranthoides]
MWDYQFERGGILPLCGTINLREEEYYLSVFWHFSSSGKFSVKSAYKEALKEKCCSSNFASSSVVLSPLLWKVPWNTEAPPKLKKKWWRVCSNAIASKENLWRRKYSDNPICPRCSQEVEAIEHIIFRCCFAIEIWHQFEVFNREGCGSVVSTAVWFNDMILSSINSVEARRKLSLVMIIGWFIWKARNAYVFDKERWPFFKVINNINGMVSDCLNVVSSHSGVRVKSQGVAPLLREKDLFLLCDGAYLHSSSLAASACLLIDKNCSLVDGYAKKVKVASALVAEALAMREACNLTEIRGLSNLVIGSDSQMVISLLTSNSYPPWEIDDFGDSILSGAYLSAQNSKLCDSGVHFRENLKSYNFPVQAFFKFGHLRVQNCDTKTSKKGKRPLTQAKDL